MNLVDQTAPDFPTLFGALMARADVASGLLTKRFLEYRSAYADDAPCVGFVVVEGGVPLFGVRFDIWRHAAGGVRWDAVDVPTVGLVDRGGSAERVSGAINAGRRALTTLVQSHRPRSITFIDLLREGTIGDISRWALDLGATARPRATQIVDLTAGETANWRGLSKSFQASVNWGRRNLSLRTVVGGDAAFPAMDELRALHMAASGRETRNERTWMLQREMVVAGEAFLVIAEMEGRCVSGALFHMTASDCYYAVSASDRALFDKPMSHIVLWQAMTMARTFGRRRFELGQQVWAGMPFDDNAPTDKELTIARFKRSFGGEAHVHLEIDLAIPPEGPLSGR